MTTHRIEIDGSFGEGGGQILRSSLALSLLTGKPFHLFHIRAGRAKPGLQPQHLQSVLAAAKIGNATLRGASLGSSDLVFEPGTIAAGTHTFDIGTAGATGLVLHTIVLPLALRGEEPSEITLIGGTHVSTSPTFHYLDRSWRRYMAALGLQVGLRLDRPGFYPRGGGNVRAFIQCGNPLQGIVLPQRDTIDSVHCVSAVAGLDRGIARRQSRRVIERLEERDLSVTTEEISIDGGPGTFVVLELPTSPAPTVFVALGARGKPAEKVADEVVDEALEYLDTPESLVDPHAADQLVLPMALAEGRSEYRVSKVTQHLTTNIAVIGYFLERNITWEGEVGQPGRVIIDGTV